MKKLLLAAFVLCLTQTHFFMGSESDQKSISSNIKFFPVIGDAYLAEQASKTDSISKLEDIEKAFRINQIAALINATIVVPLMAVCCSKDYHAARVFMLKGLSVSGLSLISSSCGYKFTSSKRETIENSSYFASTKKYIKKWF